MPELEEAVIVNTLVRQALVSAQEVMGENGLNAVLRTSGLERFIPICYLYVGSISEAVRWATGVEYEVRETQCVAKGDDYCRFEIGETLA